MKICLICSNFYPDLIGGAEWYTYYMSKELVKLGHSIEVFTQATTKKYNKIQGINIHHQKPVGFFYRFKYWPTLKRDLEKHNFDAVWILDYAQNYTIQGLRFAKKKNIPVYIMINDIQSLKTGRHPAKHLPLIFYDKYIASKILRKATALFVRTNWTKQELLNRFSVGDIPIHITPSGITINENKFGDPDNFFKKYKLKPPVILFFGRIRKQKGIFTLLSAFTLVKKQIPDATLVYTGADAKEYDGLQFIPELKRIIRQGNIKDVLFTGPLYDEIKIDCLRAASVMALPSSFENFGQAYSQALAQATPCIGTHGGGIPEIVSHNKDGFLINTGNVQQLAKYLVRLIKDKDLNRRFGDKGRQKVQQYLYPTLAKNLEQNIKRYL